MHSLFEISALYRPGFVAEKFWLRTQTGPLGSSNVWPLPNMLGEAEYAFTVFSWSMVTGPPPYEEKVALHITSIQLTSLMVY